MLTTMAATVTTVGKRHFATRRFCLALLPLEFGVRERTGTEVEEAVTELSASMSLHFSEIN